jgi:hypothetical protein
MLPTAYALETHMEHCTVPFRPLYEEEGLKVSKIESLKRKQLLSIVSQMFIRSKTVYYEVDEYDFYIVYDAEVFGYFSRYRGGKHSLNCLLVFPCFQGLGWGTVLTDISVAPSARMLPGGAEPACDMRSPEKPYTKKAIVCFRKYWQYAVVGARTVREVAQRRNISVDDAIIGLELNGFDFKSWSMTSVPAVKRPRILARRLYRA